MNTPPETRVDAAALQTAFDALTKYGPGSSRGVLQPIDDAAATATRDPALRADLELRFAAILLGAAPAVAKEYACGKLAVIAGPASVPGLAGLLPNSELAHAATNALQAMACAESGQALRESLGKLAGLPLVGVITALGMRRDAESAAALTRMLGDGDARVAAAAAAALGEIGSKAAAKALGEFLPKVPAPLRAAVADACLVGANRLLSAKDPAAAQALLDALLATEVPSHVRAAALRLGVAIRR